MPFPKTHKGLVDAGYIKQKSGRCRGCGAAIEWWKNSATGKFMPLDPGTLEPHWATCPDAEKFKSKKSGGLIKG